MTLESARVPWALALWVEEHHGEGAAKYVADEIGRLAVEGDKDGAALWCDVLDCLHAIWGAHRQVQ